MTLRRNALCFGFAALGFGALLAVRGGEPAAAPFARALGFETFLAMLALAFAARSRRGIRDRLGLAPSPLPTRALALLCVGTLALSFALDGVYRSIAPLDSGAIRQFESQLAGARGATLAAALLCYALVPGIAEELLCRGLVQRGLALRFGAARAILLASAFFGLLHLDPIHSLFAATLGLYLGAVAQLARSVRASIGCHVANNAAAVAGAAFAPGLAPAPALAIAAAAAAALGALGWCWWHHGCAEGTRAARRPPDSELQMRPGSDDA